MVLSNIFKEPRREITETAVGLALVAPAIAADYWFGEWFGAAIVGALGLFICAVVVFFVGSGIHALGEGVCNSLQRQGIHLRPRQRGR